ncbi:chemotaxis protein CheW [Marinilabilia salmonicolor]|jgi:chemotaxis signal transduction protein|uniref:Purine-binding chemotaxis protein CheW n=1 Tax=Marinilabilia salmonicolor TaxID=989 RepID=A0A2T0XR32_9BACT|nr:chemotaxis protein CheW [Marinilabilia salmonicolor]PRZ01386.1 purine-binding chemotaxis protein CheW [Marinilabilia salmonicolor]RCW29526.1 purine-binding chemotaxis protein CheW [Marinilabilia salmonicolor]
MNSYLTFKVVDEVFAVHVSHVMEIREYEKPKPVPQKVDFIAGLIEFRDEVIPLINTGLKFNLGSVEASQNSVIVILNLQKEGEEDDYRVAVMADAVSDVLELEEGELKSIHQEYKPGYVSGTYSKDGAFVFVLDPDQVFTRNDVIEMDKILAAAKEQ